MIPVLRQMLGLDDLKLYFPVKICDFDGESFDFSVRAADGNVNNLYEKIQTVMEECDEFDDCYVDVSIMEDKISIYLDTAYADDCEMAVSILLNTIAKVSGIESVMINEM